jgi:hypothetical protein
MSYPMCVYVCVVYIYTHVFNKVGNRPEERIYITWKLIYYLCRLCRNDKDDEISRACST